LGNVLYDADRIEETINKPDAELVDAYRDMILDPRDPKVIEAALKNGIGQDVIESAQNSPVYKFVKEWGLALPLHVEHRTLPMLFYVPPLLPMMARTGDGIYDTSQDSFLSSIDSYRLPLKYMASLFSAGNEAPVRYALRKQLATRTFRRQETTGDLDATKVQEALSEADTNAEQANAIHHLTAMAPYDERFVIPPMHREEAIEMLRETATNKGDTGLGFRDTPQRGA